MSEEKPKRKLTWEGLQEANRKMEVELSFPESEFLVEEKANVIAGLLLLPKQNHKDILQVAQDEKSGICLIDAPNKLVETLLESLIKEVGNGEEKAVLESIQKSDTIILRVEREFYFD